MNGHGQAAITDGAGPRFHNGPITRFVGGIFIALGAISSVVFVVTQGGSGLVALPFTIGFVLLGMAAIRLEVAATPRGLVVDTGLRRREYNWDSVEGFRIEASGGQRRILLLVDGDLAISLPVANGSILITRRRDLEQIRDALERYRNSR